MAELYAKSVTKTYTMSQHIFECEAGVQIAGKVGVIGSDTQAEDVCRAGTPSVTERRWYVFATRARSGEQSLPDEA